MQCDLLPREGYAFSVPSKSPGWKYQFACSGEPAATRDGIPVRCWVLPGNAADASTMEEVQRDLAGWKLSRVVWVMDRGMAGEAQRRILQKGGGQVILGERLRSGEAVLQEALSRPGRYQKMRENLEVKEIAVTQGSERRRFVLARNPLEAERDRQRREAALERLRTEIQRLNGGRRRRGVAHTKAVCALKTPSSLGSYVKELKSGDLRIDAVKVAEEEKLDDKYLLTTTDPSLSAEDVALAWSFAECASSQRESGLTRSRCRPHRRAAERVDCAVPLA